MAFQFLCPQGHLLQADPSQMGRTIHCPTCGTLFVVPTVAVAAEVPAVTAVPPRAPAALPAMPPPPRPPEPEPFDLNLRRRARRRVQIDLPTADEEPAEEAMPEATETPADTFDPEEESGTRMVHVYCPAGHELVTPLDTMGKDVLCPHCGEQFRLDYQESKECKEERIRKEEARQQKLGNSWLIWSVVVGVAVLVMLVVMMIIGSR